VICTGVNPNSYQGANLIGDTTDCIVTLHPTDLTGDPQLGTFTASATPGRGHIPLLATSRAIDTGNEKACPPNDQLGQSRVGPCDMGAVEFLFPPLLHLQGALTALGPARLWVGLRNSDAVGLRLDLNAEVFLNATSLGGGQLSNVASGSSGFNNAGLHTIPLTLIEAVEVGSGDILSLTLSVRRTCAGGGPTSGTPRLWFNDRQAHSHFGATIGDTTGHLFLRSGFALATTLGPGPKQTSHAGVGNQAPCPNRPFKLFGTWSLTLP
jgi:hypothetical protein